MTFGDDLKVARTEAGLTQQALADAIGMSKVHVAAVENDRAKPSYDMVDGLEKALDTRFNVVSPKDVPDGVEPEFTAKDEAPRVRRGAKKAAAKRVAAPRSTLPPLAVQLEVPYHLLAMMARPRVPVTADVIDRQAKACAQAWDQFLLRYPALRERIEQGAVAADIVNLITAHAPILSTARAEIAAQQAAQEGYEGGLNANAA